MKIELTKMAIRDLRALREYISRDSEVYADRFLDKLVASFRSLAEFPKLGRVVEDSETPNVRELVFQSYRIFYRILPDKIEILTVIHGGRDMENISPKPWEIL